MTLLYPWWLAPALLFLTAYTVFKGNPTNSWRRVIPESVLRYLQYAKKAHRNRHPGFLLGCIACIALSGPSSRTGDSETYRHSQGWIVLADVSRSMTLADIVPSRLSAMRDVALQLADNATASSITLIVYAGDAFIVAPPSFDTTHFKSNTALLEYPLLPPEGSNPTRALSLAWSVIEGSQLINARLFLLSDTGGFNNRSDAAVARLADRGHRTDVILFGTESSDNAPLERGLARDMAKSGNGVLLESDALGQVNFAKLNLNAAAIDNSVLTGSGLTTLQWANKSHWILLLTIPLMLLLFYRESRR